MRKRTKIWLITATALVFTGCILFGGVMVILNRDFTRLSTVRHQTNEHAIDATYTNVSIVTDTADVALVPSADAKTAVVCYERENVRHTVTVKEGTLVIQAVDTRKWYEHIALCFDTPKITVYLPQGQWGALSVKTVTGDVDVPKDFTFESIDISGSTGDVACGASASGAVRIQTSTGAVRAENLSVGALTLSVSTGKATISGVTCAGDIRADVSTGQVTLYDVTCQNLSSSGNTGNLSLKNVVAAHTFSIRRTTGDVTFDRCDAADVTVTTNTGDVCGSLLSDKVFFTKTATGRIDVPKTASGGKCDVTTTTGNILITVSQ